MAGQFDEWHLGLLITLLVLLFALAVLLDVIARVRACNRQGKMNVTAMEAKLAEEVRERKRAEVLAHDAQSAAAEANAVALAARSAVDVAKLGFVRREQSLEEMDRLLRENQTCYSRVGRIVTVRVLVVPDTGRVGIEWMVDWDRPYPPRVAVRLLEPYRVDVEQAFQGMWAGSLACGRTYKMSIAVYDERRELEELLFSVQVPSVKRWRRRVGEALPQLDEKSLSAQKRRELLSLAEEHLAGEIDKLEFIEEARQRLKASRLSEDDQRDVLGSLETWLAQREGK